MEVRVGGGEKGRGGGGPANSNHFLFKRKTNTFPGTPAHFCLQLRARSVQLDDKEG